jgi:hypothetical protein
VNRKTFGSTFGVMIAACGLAVGFGGAATVPIPLPPRPTGVDDGDGGPLAGLTAARAAQEAAPAADLTARVMAATKSLDATYPAQSPGAAPPAGMPAWHAIGPTRVIHERVGGYSGPTQFNGGQTGRIRKILVDPRDPNVVYVLFGEGGLWKTTNFLQQQPTWTPLTDDLDTVSSGSVAFGSSPDTLYLGLGDPFGPLSPTGLGGLMLKSRDGGLTWSSPVKLPGAAIVNDLAVDSSGPTDVVLVATDVGLFRSNDAGDTYVSLQHAPVDDPATPIDDQLFSDTFVWSIARTGAGWLVTGTNGGEYDWGNGWLAVSTDHGATWSSDAHDGVDFASGGRATLAVGAPGDNVVYAFQSWAAPYQAYQRDVFRSDDGGLTWRALHTTTTAPANPTPETPTVWVGFYQAYYDQLIWVDPTDPARNTVFIGGDLYTAKTTDGGASWRMMTQWLGAFGLPYLHADEHTAAFVPGKKPLLVVGNDGGLAVSDDGGLSWSFDKNTGIVAAAAYGLASTPADPNALIIGTQDTGPLVRQGNTGVFNEMLGGDGMVPAIGQADNSVSLVGLPFGAVASSTFDPQNHVWKWRESLPQDADAYFLTPLVAPTAAADPSGQVFFTYTAHKVLRTLDGGRTWTSILSGDPSGPAVVRYSSMNLAVDPASIDGVAVGDYNGVVHVTHDGGKTWTTRSLLSVGGYDGFNVTLAWAPSGTIYVGSENTAAGAVRVMRSNDGGSTWFAAADAGLPDLPIEKLAPDLSDPTGRTLYAGTWVGVFRSRDGGATWTLFGAGLPHVVVSDLSVSQDGSVVRAATFGRGAWEARLR